VVETWQVKGVRSRSVHQLTPELAEEIAQVDTVIFVDASLNSSDNIPIHMQPIMAPDADWNRFSSMLHTYHPTSLLALVKLLYQKQPHAYVVMIPALNLELGENLSPLAQEGMAIALHILQDWLHNPTPSPK
jgi:Ni,Fe-hydrogenase maturation factor